MYQSHQLLNQTQLSILFFIQLKTAIIARRVIDPTDDGQNLQQFMSDSPWSGSEVFKQIQTEIKERPELQDGMLTLDESGDERAGGQSAGAARQYLGRLGKVEMGQVGVALGYYADEIWAMVDAELYLRQILVGERFGQITSPVAYF